MSDSTGTELDQSDISRIVEFISNHPDGIFHHAVAFEQHHRVKIPCRAEEPGHNYLR